MLIFATSASCSQEITAVLKAHGFEAFTFARAGLYPVNVRCDDDAAIKARELAERVDPQVRVRL